MVRAALVISFLALLGAWGGPALADALLTGRDIKDGSLTGRDVRNESLTSRDVRDRSLHGRDLKSNSVTGRVVSGLSGRDILPNSIDGSKIAEETLDIERARSAGHADRADVAARAEAISGARLVGLRADLGPGQQATALDLEGLTLKAACSASGALSLRAATAAGPAWIRTGGTFRAGSSTAASTYGEDDDFQPHESFDALGGEPDNLRAELVYAAPGGAVVTVAFLAEQGVPRTGGAGCMVAGTATAAAE